MRTRILIAAVSAVTLIGLTSCERPAGGGAETPAPAAPSFTHSFGSDLSGYYMPVGEVRVGNWAFDHVFVGQTAEFQSWEAGGRSEAFGPVMLQFDDVTSPMVQTEIGEAHSITVRVLPTAYSVTDTSLSFEGRSEQLGAVSFEGAVDPGALATSRRNLGTEGVVVTGTLKVGDTPARNVQLRWWAGD